MDDKTELQISINRAESLKKMTKMSGWNIIEDFLADKESQCQRELDDNLNKDLVDIQSARTLKKFILEFKGLLNDTEISAQYDRQTLKDL